MPGPRKAAQKQRDGLEPGRPRKKVRIICSDPDATDSSADEGSCEKRVKRIVGEAFFPTAKSGMLPKSLESVDKSSEKRNLGTGKYRGVRLRKWGKWAAEIHDPLQQKRVWLGTYDSAEEASQVYESKRLQFEASSNGQHPYGAEEKKLSVTNKELIELEKIGDELDLDMGFGSCCDFGLLNDMAIGFVDLPNFDFDLDLESFSWMEEGVNGVTLPLNMA